MFLVPPQIFPINIKGLAGSLVTLVSWTGSWVVSYTFNYLFEWSSAGDASYNQTSSRLQYTLIFKNEFNDGFGQIISGTFFIFAVICGVGILFIGKIVPETKGRTLEEIQASFTHIQQ